MKPLYVKINDNIIKKLNDYCDKTGEFKSKVIEQALKQFFENISIINEIMKYVNKYQLNLSKREVKRLVNAGLELKKLNLQKQCLMREINDLQDKYVFMKELSEFTQMMRKAKNELTDYLKFLTTLNEQEEIERLDQLIALFEKLDSKINSLEILRSRIFKPKKIRRWTT
mgnify:CR=1 FL=1